jgi:hypothetical protein
MAGDLDYSLGTVETGKMKVGGKYFGWGIAKRRVVVRQLRGGEIAKRKKMMRRGTFI